MTYKERIKSTEDELAKKNEQVLVLENNMRTVTIEKEKFESQLTSVRQVSDGASIVYSIDGKCELSSFCIIARVLFCLCVREYVFIYGSVGAYEYI